MTPRIRPAHPEDYPHFVRWFPMLGSGDPVPSVSRWQQRFLPTMVIAEVNDEPAGYGHTETFAEDGYIRHLVVDPAYRRRGVGRALLLQASQRMRAAGCIRWRLNVKPDNTPARTLYEAQGLRVVRSCAALRFAWDIVDTLPKVQAGLRVCAPESSERRALERRFDLPVGQLDPEADRPEIVVRAVMDADGRLVGVARFDVSFPGAFPFRAASGEAAVALLTVLRRFAAKETMGVVWEDGPDGEAMLLGAGATVAFRFVHMCGPL